MEITSNGLYKPIPDYPQYEIHISGDVRKIRNYKKHALNTTVKHGERIVRLDDADGKRRVERVHRLMQNTYLAPPKHGEVLYFKNGNKQDVHLDNLGYIQRTELGKVACSSKWRKPVAKLSASGELLDLYPSATQAGKANYMCPQAVMNHCNGKVKADCANDGNRYVWDSEFEYSRKINE